MGPGQTPGSAGFVGLVGPATLGERRAAAGAAARPWIDGSHLQRPTKPAEPGVWPGPIWRTARRRRAAMGRAAGPARRNRALGPSAWRATAARPSGRQRRVGHLLPAAVDARDTA